MERDRYTSFDGKDLSAVFWRPVGEPRAAVLISHGMAEHIARYDEFALFLADRGYLVVGADQRGHGLTDPDRLGLPCGEDMFADSVWDLAALIGELKKRGYRTALFGHSYGSFLAQSLLAGGGGKELFAAVLSGSALQKGASVSFGARLAASKSKKKKDEPGKTFASLTFGKYDKRFGEGLGGWLNSDPAAVGRYNSDPMCGFTCSNGFYKSFFSGLDRLSKEERAPLGGLKILLVSGADDPVGGEGKLVKKLAERLTVDGGNVTTKLIEGARHEVLNEPCRAAVYEGIESFLSVALDSEK